MLFHRGWYQHDHPSLCRSSRRMARWLLQLQFCRTLSFSNGTFFQVSPLLSDLAGILVEVRKTKQNGISYFVPVCYLWSAFNELILKFTQSNFNQASVEDTKTSSRVIKDKTIIQVEISCRAKWEILLNSRRLSFREVVLIVLAHTTLLHHFAASTISWHREYQDQKISDMVRLKSGYEIVSATSRESVKVAARNAKN